MADRIQRIKRELPIENVIAEYVELKSSGTTLVGRCPFHNDRIPSLTIYPQSGTYHCFGCGAHGDVISFVRAMENLSFSQALELLDSFTSHNGKGYKENNSRGKAA